jgi:type VI protein secretion system component Hcp
MNNRIFKFGIASLVVVPAALAMAGQGAHGGGGGAGKVNVHDISITKNANALLAFPGFKGGVFVAAGDVNGDGRADLDSAARKGGAGSLRFAYEAGRESGPGRSASANNLKQLGMGMHSAKEVYVSLLRPAGTDKVQEFATYKLSDVTLKRGSSSGGDRPMESLSLNFTKIEYVKTHIGTANGGIWKTSNGPEARIGMLLPAVQKIRG